eukprot:TRINITY_DN4546_c0_g2_i1.p2 TRINITY_DN4546_c0_g2~~TRINITY_DN4546_c0_g2_i1.p2  ORF type:complete len:278 (+),score=54.49 TRINITY_DN4546_c0_g2_i1:227-1060(+)
MDMFSPPDYYSTGYHDDCFDIDQVAIEMFDELMRPANEYHNNNNNTDTLLFLPDVQTTDDHSNYSSNVSSIEDASSFSGSSNDHQNPLLADTTTTTSPTVADPSFTQPGSPMFPEPDVGDVEQRRNSAYGQDICGVRNEQQPSGQLLSSNQLQVVFIPAGGLADNLVQVNNLRLLDIGNNPMLLFKQGLGMVCQQQNKPKACSKEERLKKIQRYREKKKNRNYTRSEIRYPLRKQNADRRPRVKGRFVKQKVEQQQQQQSGNVLSQQQKQQHHPLNK